MGRGQGHHQGDSLNAEMTGIWTARCTDSRLKRNGFHRPRRCRLPKTVIEYLRDEAYDVFTLIGWNNHEPHLGTHAVAGGMREAWLKDEPQRLEQFNTPEMSGLDDLLERVQRSERFYAHVFLRHTHRPWTQNDQLFALVGETPPPQPPYYPHDARCARRTALDKPDEFAALRRRGLAEADRVVRQIFEATRHVKDLTYIVYSNHGEVFDHFRYHLPYRTNPKGMIEGTSHGNYPYEVLYANMQMWAIPGRGPRVMQGIGRSIDITPTILDLAGVARVKLDGQSMLPHFSSGSFPARDRYAENQLGACVSMVRTDGYKFVSTGTILPPEQRRDVAGPDHHRLAVFDLNCDPYEYVNLVDTAQGRQVLTWAVAKHRSLKGGGANGLLNRCAQWLTPGQ